MATLPAFAASLNEVVIAVIVEKRERVEDLDAILAVKGLAMVQFGRRARPGMLHVGQQADRGATRQRGVFDVYIVVRKFRSDARVSDTLFRV
jgi:hypothetical protein